MESILTFRMLVFAVPVLVAHLGLIVGLYILFRPAVPAETSMARPEAVEEPRGAGAPASTETYVIESSGAGKTHVVAPGESYWKIAQRYGVSIETLMAHNGHSRTYVLKAGEVVKIPAR